MLEGILKVTHSSCRKKVWCYIAIPGSEATAKESADIVRVGKEWLGKKGKALLYVYHLMNVDRATKLPAKLRPTLSRKLDTPL